MTAFAHKMIGLGIVFVLIVLPLESNAAAGSSASSSSSGGGGFDKITFDLGLSSGTYNNVNYTEAELGLNLYFNDYFAWRNAVFGRFATGYENVFGIDTSLRGILALGGKGLGFTAFAGPGYRFVTLGDSLPFVEGGFVVKMGGFAVGAGLKELLDSWVHSGQPNDTQIFLILAGGGSL